MNPWETKYGNSGCFKLADYFIIEQHIHGEVIQLIDFRDPTAKLFRVTDYKKKQASVRSWFPFRFQNK